MGEPGMDDSTPKDGGAPKDPPKDESKPKDGGAASRDGDAETDASTLATIATIARA
jgi:hypothetical protein